MAELPKYFYFRVTPVTNKGLLTQVMVEDASNADVVEVVRCRDCRYDHACLTQQFVEENSKIPFNRDEFFCPDGKRREPND